MEQKKFFFKSFKREGIDRILKELTIINGAIIKQLIGVTGVDKYRVEKAQQTSHCVYGNSSKKGGLL